MTHSEMHLHQKTASVKDKSRSTVADPLTLILILGYMFIYTCLLCSNIIPEYGRVSENSFEVNCETGGDNRALHRADPTASSVSY